MGGAAWSTVTAKWRLEGGARLAAGLVVLLREAALGRLLLRAWAGGRLEWVHPGGAVGGDRAGRPVGIGVLG